jgi:hypothetical protein
MMGHDPSQKPGRESRLVVVTALQSDKTKNHEAAELALAWEVAGEIVMLAAAAF